MNSVMLPAYVIHGERCDETPCQHPGNRNMLGVNQCGTGTDLFLVRVSEDGNTFPIYLCAWHILAFVLADNLGREEVTSHVLDLLEVQAEVEE